MEPFPLEALLVCSRFHWKCYLQVIASTGNVTHMCRFYWKRYSHVSFLLEALLTWVVSTGSDTHMWPFPLEGPRRRAGEEDGAVGGGELGVLEQSA